MHSPMAHEAIGANSGAPQGSISASVVDLQHVAAKFLLGLV
jgi:hypothetical protein